MTDQGLQLAQIVRDMIVDWQRLLMREARCPEHTAPFDAFADAYLARAPIACGARHAASEVRACYWPCWRWRRGGDARARRVCENARRERTTVVGEVGQH